MKRLRRARRRIIAYVCAGGLVLCAACGASPSVYGRQTLLSLKAAGDAARDGFTAFYSAASAECRAESRNMLDGMDHYVDCMEPWDAAAGEARRMIGVLNAAQRTALDAIMLYEACAVDDACKPRLGRMTVGMGAAIARVVALVEDVQRLMEAFMAGADPGTPTRAPASQPVRGGV